MALKKGEKINKWIDLSKLPVDSHNKIQWKQSVGYNINFEYGDISGVLTILQYISYKSSVVIYIEGYTNKNGYTICVDQLKYCMLGNVLKRTISETHPDLVKYFIDKNIPDSYTYGSSLRVKTKCPFCGTEKEYHINDLCSRGFSCPMCSDGKSYPEKFMYNILKQVGVNFLNEVTKKDKGFEWVERYRYDFYFEKDDNRYFIETDGEMHFRDFFRTHDESLAVDMKKDELANKHNIKTIRINCRYNDVRNRFKLIKDNILKSELNNILDLSIIDWDAANESAIDSNIKRVAKMWDSGIHNKKQIADSLGISADTVKIYLLTATDIGCCTYDHEEDLKIWRNNVSKKLSKPIKLSKNGIIVGVFRSASDLDRKSVDLFGVHMIKQYLSAACRYPGRTAYGYNVEYITKEEYEQLLPQFQTVQNEFNNLQEVI